MRMKHIATWLEDIAYRSGYSYEFLGSVFDEAIEDEKEDILAGQTTVENILQSIDDIAMEQDF